MHFTRNTKDRFTPDVMINNVLIPWTDSYKYLGVILDKRLTFHKQVQRAINNIKAARHSLFHLIGRNSSLSYLNKAIIYKSYIRPILTYAIQVWGCAAKSHIKRLAAFQNHTLRCAANAKWYVRNVNIRKELRVKSIPEFIQTIAKNFYDKIPKVKNRLLSGLPLYDIDDARANRKRPRASMKLDFNF